MFQSWIETNKHAHSDVKLKQRGHNTIQTPHPPEITNEADFIIDVKHRYIKKKNTAQH